MREYFEQLEERLLAPYGQKSKDTKGRLYPITPCDLRTEYQRDRDRIIHCKSFRRLKHKTQVFLSPTGDHYRTRLTHTLEVSQVARTMARCLRLNEDLTEAIALGHDLGHTPFGHAGERVLDRLISGGFKHNEQSLRVVDKLEKLNLTYEVRNGILCHTGGTPAQTLEGRLVHFADRIAYINHDIDDALRAKVIKQEDLPKRALEVLGKTHGQRIDTLIRAVIKGSQDRPDIALDPEIADVMNELRNFMYNNIYNSESEAKREEKKAEDIIASLYDYYIKHPDQLPVDANTDTDASFEQQVCDYIAGMTDQFAIRQFERLFIPMGWNRY